MENNKNRTEYIRRINKSLEFISSRLDQKLSLEDIAAASHFSPFHFHRIFHGIVGETVNDYVTRKKMEKAARTLICSPELSITDVAELGGFSSSANFAKSFKSYFGCRISFCIKNPPKESFNNYYALRMSVRQGKFGE